MCDGWLHVKLCMIKDTIDKIKIIHRKHFHLDCLNNEIPKKR